MTIINRIVDLYHESFPTNPKPPKSLSSQGIAKLEICQYLKPGGRDKRTACRSFKEILAEAELFKEDMLE